MDARKIGGCLLLLMLGVMTSLGSVAATAGNDSARYRPEASNELPSQMRSSMKFPIPASLTAEHAALHAELAQITRSGGKTGEAARAVDAALQPHFEKEEQYALPPLGLLSALANGHVSADMAAVLPLTERLKRDLPQMLAEHQQIVAALNRLASAATSEHNADAERFAHELIHHAQTEEQVTYPAAILVGEYLKLRLNPENAATGGR